MAYSDQDTKEYISLFFINEKTSTLMIETLIKTILMYYKKAADADIPMVRNVGMTSVISNVILKEIIYEEGQTSNIDDQNNQIKDFVSRFITDMINAGYLVRHSGKQFNDTSDYTSIPDNFSFDNAKTITLLEKSYA
jgi:hypothetical protein